MYFRRKYMYTKTFRPSDGRLISKDAGGSQDYIGL